MKTANAMTMRWMGGLVLVAAAHLPGAASFVVPHPHHKTFVSFLRATTGPKAAGRRRTPRGAQASPPPRRRSPGTRPTSRHPTASVGVQPQPPFDPAARTAAQTPQHAARPLDLQAASSLRCVSDDAATLVWGAPLEPPVFRYHSLADIFPETPGLATAFGTDAAFRQALRAAIRQDIFACTRSYANLSPRAQAILLEPASSLQGSWRQRDDAMVHTTAVLQACLGTPLTGAALLQRMGDLCGPEPSTHWMDIVGVLDRPVSHSWHQDTGRHANATTVLWGFPVDDDYTGTGVFSHLVPLARSCRRDESADSQARAAEPMLFAGAVDECHIVRPEYKGGQELLLYRDRDVLHSSPDVAYRTNLMRFM